MASKGELVGAPVVSDGAQVGASVLDPVWFPGLPLKVSVGDLIGESLNNSTVSRVANSPRSARMTPPILLDNREILVTVFVHPENGTLSIWDVI